MFDQEAPININEQTGNTKMTITELLASEKTRDHSYSISSYENAYVVKISYRQEPKPDDKGKISDYWEYKTKNYVFQTWPEAVKFLGDNELAMPPR